MTKYKKFFVSTVFCRVRKLFRQNLKGAQTLPNVTKLNRKKIRWIVRHCAELRDFSTGEAAEIYHVSQRRVQQILKEYRKTGEIPVLKKERRPKTRLTEEQERIIEEVWKETRVGVMSKVTPLRTRLSLESRGVTLL